MHNGSIKRIGLLILSNTWGGAEESVYKIAKYVSKKHFKVFLLVNDFLYERYTDISDIEVINLGRLESNKKIQKIRTLFSLHKRFKQEIKNKKIDLVHAQLENTLLMFVFAKLPKVPMIFTLRGEETSIYLSPKSFEHLIIKRQMKRLFEDREVSITAVSNWLKDQYGQKEKDKIIVCVNGVDTKLFKPRKVKRHKNTIFYVGRYAEGKGVDDLVEIARYLPNYIFLFAGVGPMAEIINLKNTINLGFKKREEIVKLFNKVTICVFPTSFAEGMPNVGLEALSSAVPIIASKISYSEIIENGVDGIIINPKDQVGLMKAIKRLMGNPSLRKKISENARKKALNYDIRKTVKNYEEIYLSLVK